MAAENVRLGALVERLEGRVAELEAELGRHSQNSGKPPSSDTLTQRAAQAARRRGKRSKGARKPGKQPGTEGKHLEMVEAPDRVVGHAPEACGACGASLEGTGVVGIERRQVFDLPEVRLWVTEHQAERRRCRCGHVSAALFPPEAQAAACYGPRLRGLASYLLIRQHLPIERTAELLSEVCGAPVSTGWLAGLPGEAASGLAGFLNEVRRLLAVSEVLGVDETGARIAGERLWFHTASTDRLTLIDCHQKRGVEATDHMGVLPAFSGVAVHDCWKPYFTYTRCDHALCGAHLLGDLAAVAEVASQRRWAEAMAQLLVEAKEALEEALAAGGVGLTPGKLKALRRRYTMIIAAGRAANPEPASGRKRNALERQSYNLVKRLDRLRAQIQRSWWDPRVPFSNNQAERDLRMVKLQQKISGCFRTLSGAQAFCAVRSYLQTAAKRGQNRLDVLTALYHGQPWMPTLPAGP